MSSLKQHQKLPFIDEENFQTSGISKELNESDQYEKSEEIFFSESVINDEDLKSNDISSQSQNKKPNQKSIIVVHGQSCLDLDEIFGYENNEKQKRYTLNNFSKIFSTTLIEDEELPIPSLFIYFVLIVAVFVGASIGPFLSSFRYNKFQRSGWRFFCQSLMLIPFVIYEKRNAPDKFKSAYNIKYIFQKENFRLLFISALNLCINNLVVSASGEFTHETDALIFASLGNFFLSIYREFKGEFCLFIERLGRIMCICGILLVSVDEIWFDLNIRPDDLSHFANNWHLNRTTWQRLIIGNLIPILSSACVAYFSQLTVEIKTIYPPFLSMFLISSLVTWDFVMFSFFLDGASFSFDSRWGLFGILINDRFTEMIYLMFILNCILFLSQVYLTRNFEPIIPATCGICELPMSALFRYIFNVQYMPGPISVIGYFVTQPGQFIILLGQYLLKKEEEAKQKARQRAVEQPPEHYSIEVRSHNKISYQFVRSGKKKKRTQKLQKPTVITSSARFLSDLEESEINQKQDQQQQQQSKKKVSFLFESDKHL